MGAALHASGSIPRRPLNGCLTGSSKLFAVPPFFCLPRLHASSIHMHSKRIEPGKVSVLSKRRGKSGEAGEADLDRAVLETAPTGRGRQTTGFRAGAAAAGRGPDNPSTDADGRASGPPSKGATMIAVNREWSEVRSRQEAYALRRVLVGELQKACRSVPRRIRAERLRRFADEWSEFVQERRLGLLRRAVALGPAVATEAGDLWPRSFLLALAVGRVPKAAPAPPAAASPGVSAQTDVKDAVRGSMAKASKNAGPAAGRALDSVEERARWRDRQGDLFSPDLVTRTLLGGTPCNA